MKLWLALLFLPLLALNAAELDFRQDTLPPKEAAKQGKELAERILSFQPERNMTNTGVLRIRANGKRTEIPLESDTVVTNSGWLSIYRTRGSDRAHFDSVTVVHSEGQPNEYLAQNVSAPPGDTNSFHKLTGDQIMRPFAGSDFWLADIGLEFFHWPEQHLLRKEIKRGQSCYVLESVNPHPTPAAYSRVLSWLDIESVQNSGGPAIVFATAYDANGKPLKDFAPKALKKVQGEYQVEEMRMDNRQIGSSSWFEFDLDQSK